LVEANDVDVGDCLVTIHKKFTRVREIETYLGEGVYTIILDEADFLVSFLYTLFCSILQLQQYMINKYFLGCQ
jgi:hypothetical protein